MIMFKKILISSISVLTISAAIQSGYANEVPQPTIKVSEADEPMAKGTFEPEWESLRKYKTPEWFRNAKFGIWAHWGPQ